VKFRLSQEQEILKNTARKFLQKECPMAFVREMISNERGYSPSIWKSMAELGWMGLLFEEKYAGSAATFLDLSIILEEMGRALLPGPFFSTVILSGITIMETANEKLKKKFLPSIASGDSIMTLALTEREASYTADEIKTRASPRGNAFSLNGVKMFVPDAHIADYIIIPARSAGSHRSGISLFIVEAKDKDVRIQPLKSIHHLKQCKVLLVDVHVPQGNLLGKQGQGWSYIESLLPKAVAGKCCQMLGAMYKVFEMTLHYAQERHQFDRPLSAFQVIQHYCADMAIDLESSRLITYEAAWRLSTGLPSTKEVAMAKAWCSDAFKKLGATSHQIHGAIGFTEEYDLQLFSRCAKAWELELGNGNFHREIVARQMGL
jgi:alkylation response protein AidB-like acyl-CoA dehydrogenase